MFANLPISGLRAFEAAARLHSFKLAAAELSVTPTAISHQVRNLERNLGMKLFERRPQGLELTLQGQQLFEGVHGALLDLAHTVERLRPVPSTAGLTLTTSHSFAALWLVPRLGRFYEKHPGYEVKLAASAEIVDLSQNAGMDIAIRYGGGPFTGLYEACVLTERFGVYGTPAAIADAALKAPRRITVNWGSSTLYERAWRAWCAAAGLAWSELDAKTYDEENYALHAALAGQGLMLGSSALVSDMVERGLLQQYRPEISVAGGRYTVLCMPGRERHPPVAAFLKWITSELL